MSKVDSEIKKALVTRIMDNGASYACGMLIMHGVRKTKGQTAKEYRKLCPVCVDADCATKSEECGK